MTYLNAPKFKNPKTGNLGLIFDEITDDTRLISIVSKPIKIVVVVVVLGSISGSILGSIFGLIFGSILGSILG